MRQTTRLARTTVLAVAGAGALLIGASQAQPVLIATGATLLAMATTPWTRRRAAEASGDDTT